MILSLKPQILFLCFGDLKQQMCVFVSVLQFVVVMLKRPPVLQRAPQASVDPPLSSSQS